MQRLKILLLFLFLCTSNTCFCQERPTIREIEFSELRENWYDFFAVKEKKLDDRITEFEEKLAQIPEKLSEENRQQSIDLINEIESDLQSYAKITTQPLPIIKPAPPLSKSYTVDELIELNKRFQKTTFELKAKKDKNLTLKQKLPEIQSELDKKRRAYREAEYRSENKILLALELINLRLDLEISKKKISRLEMGIEADTRAIAHLKEETAVGKKRLTSPQLEMNRLARQVNPAQRVWEDYKLQQESKELELSEEISVETTEGAESNNHYLMLQIMEYTLQEMKAHKDFIQIDIKYTLSQVISEPDFLDKDTLATSMQDWSSQLSQFRNKTNELAKRASQYVKRATQLISLEEEKKVQDQERRLLLKSIVELGQQNLLKIQSLNKEIEKSTFLLNILQSKTTPIAVEGKNWVFVGINYAYEVFKSGLEKLNKTAFYIGQTRPVSYLDMLQFILILFITWWVSRLITKTLDTITKRRKGIRKAVVYRINHLFRYVILFVGFLIALTSIGFDMSNIIILASALGVGLGFGLQNIFNNFLSGIIILFQSHLKVGDYIELDSGMRGEIREINVRSTVLTTNDGVDVLVPNSQMVSDKVTNWTLRDPYRRIHVDFTVAYGSDLDKVERVVVEAAKKVPSTLKKIGVREPRVYLKKFGDNALEMELVVWVNEKFSRRSRNTNSKYLWVIEHSLRTHGLAIPFPQRDLHIKSVFGKKDLSKFLKEEGRKKEEGGKKEEGRRKKEEKEI